MEIIQAKIKKFVPVERTARVMQMEGMFDVAPSRRSEESWHVKMELPDKWNIGLIVGPSGSGKTSIARELWREHIVGEWPWDEKQSVLDGFPESMSIKEITSLLSSVGFSSPPNWLRPYNVLSTGERFRVDLARTLVEMRDLAVIDEYTSVVDRTVAQIGSAALSKTVRARKQRVILLSCHYDIIDWLEPDWIYHPATSEFLVTQDSSGRYLQRRPSIDLKIRRVHHSAWEVFRKFHYLDTSINKAAFCFVAYWEENPVAFCSVLSFPHPRSPGWRFHRLVCLPDYQGIGIGVRLADYVASVFAASGKPVFRVLSHPAVIHACMKSPVWGMYRSPQTSPKTGRTSTMKKWEPASQRLVAGFEYIGPPADEKVYRSLLRLAMRNPIVQREKERVKAQKLKLEKELSHE